jgi:hypothetical protein
MNSLEILILSQCSVCKSVKLGDEWYSKEMFEYINVLNPYKYTHTVCSEKCTMIGYGLSGIDAEEIFKEAKK